MTLLDALFNAPAAQATGWALIHLTWQATLIAVALALTGALMRKSAASTRYAVAWAALAATLVLPIMTGSAMYTQLRDDARSRSVTPSVATSSPARHLMIPAGVEKVSTPSSSGWRLTFVSPRAMLRAAMPWIVALWVVGVAFLSARLLFGFLYTSRMVRSAVASEPRWSDSVARIAAAIGLRKSIRVLQSARVAVPTVVGWLKPAIVLPAAAFTGLSPEQFETILAHEVAHIRRHDFLLNVLQVAIETLLFYHPAVWWISRQVRIERENCCDDIAVAVCGDPVSYAHALTRLELLRADVPQTVLASTGGSLLSRIRRLLGRTEERWPLTPTFVSAAALIAGAALLIIVPMHLMANERSEQQSNAEPKKSSVEIEVVAPAPDGKSGATVVTTKDDGTREVRIERRVIRGADLAEPPVPPEPPDTPDAPFIVTVPPIPDFDLPDIDIDIPDFDFPRAFAFTTNDEGDFTFSTGGHPGVHIADGGHVVDYGHPSKEDAAWMKQLGIDSKYLQELRSAGYGSLKADELASMKALGVSGDYATRINAAWGSTLEPRQLTRMKILNVTPQFVSEIRAVRYGDFSPEEIAKFKVTGVTADTLRKLQAEGKTKLSARDIVHERLGGDARRVTREVRVHVPDVGAIRRPIEVTPEYESEIASAGLTNLSHSDLMRLRVVGVTGDYVRELRKAGITVTDVGRLVRMKALGLDAKYIAELSKAGYANLSVDDLIRLRRSGIDAEFLRELRALKEK